MENMFRSASVFNQDISGWCVSQFSTEQAGFSLFSALTNANKPLWGKEFKVALTTGSDSQTATVASAIADIKHTATPICSGSISASASGLPSGASMAFANNVATISGSANATGIFNYTLTFTGASTSQAVTGTITVNAAVTADTTPPVITLAGSSTINLTVGDSFTDPGATATDDVDGDITLSITASGIVDTSTAGTYVITYSVTDTAGNTATADRTIIVSAPVSGIFIPDDNFEQFLIDNGHDDVMDNYISTSSALNVTELKLNANSVGQQNAGNGITDLTGVNEFINLTWLNVGFNNIGSINVSNLTLLKHLFLFETGLNSIDVSNNINLETFAISGSSISSIDISASPNITLLTISDTGISTLDLSNNNLINQLTIQGNSNLNSLDISQITSPLSRAFFNGSPNLDCIKVNSSQFNSVAQFHDEDSMLIYQLDCSNPGITYNISITASATTSGNQYGDDFILGGTDRNGSISGVYPDININLGDVINFDINVTGNKVNIVDQNNVDLESWFIAGAQDTESGTVIFRPRSRGTYYYRNWNDANVLKGTITVQ